MRKKILILISSGGNGHKAIARALQEYLDGEYTVVVQDVFLEVLQSMDLFFWLTRGRITETDSYNYFLQRSWHTLLNIGCMVGMWWYRLRAKRVRKLLYDNLLVIAPDMVISVAPFVSGPLFDATCACTIPLLIIPTDFDIPHFVQTLRWHETNNPNMLTIGMYEPDEYMVQRVHTLTHIPRSCMTVIGVPLYKEFLKGYNFAPHDDAQPAVITVMFGGLGGVHILSVLEVLTKMTVPCVINVCIGYNNALTDEIQKISFPEHITVVIIPFTLAVGTVIARSDLIITKSGGSTVAQAMALGVPILIVATLRTLIWERYNQTFVVRNYAGMVARANAEIVQYAHIMLTKTFRTDFKIRTQHLRKCDASKILPVIVERMIANNQKS